MDGGSHYKQNRFSSQFIDCPILKQFAGMLAQIDTKKAPRHCCLGACHRAFTSCFPCLPGHPRSSANWPTKAYPLQASSLFLAAGLSTVAGFEPVWIWICGQAGNRTLVYRVQTGCSPAELHALVALGASKTTAGFEPASSVLQTDAWPLGYVIMCLGSLWDQGEFHPALPVHL